jgi:hypothetical protein
LAIKGSKKDRRELAAEGLSGVDWLNPNRWKVPAQLIGDWKSIFSGGSYLLKPLSRLASRFKGKAQQKSIYFVSNDRLCNWGEARLKDQPATYINGHWDVTNSTDRDVTILKARLAEYATPFAQLTRRSIPPNHQPLEFSADFTFFPPIGRAPEPIVADVIFTDNFANKHRVRTTFTYIGRAPADLVSRPQLLGRL